MKSAILSVLTSIGFIISVSGQDTLPLAGPSFSFKDSATAGVISVASMQVYPVCINRQKKEKVETPSPQIRSSASPAASDPAPIRDWSHPPGGMGATRSGSILVKLRPMTREYTNE